MKFIQKQKPPPLLLKHAKTAHANYNNIPPKAKDQVREYLLNEQGYICCYCMQRISISTIRIEHWRCQASHRDKQLEYSNMLGMCPSGDKGPQHLKHCGTSKGDTDIKINPTDRYHNCEALVKFSTNGEVYSDDAAVNTDLNNVLKLNLQTLVNNRKIFLQAALVELTTRHPKGTWTSAILEKEIGKWNTRNGGHLAEYCQVIINYLSKRLQSINNEELYPLRYSARRDIKLRAV